ncbi:MAG: hypothetical protein OXT69_11560 [Candidatus Poribacteria bacterium]|nr:hypothetical protein [Candidatus Poribacteria bacterium]
MSSSVAEFERQSETIREQLEKAIVSYRQLAEIELSGMTRKNAAELYRQFMEVEAVFEGVDGVLDQLRTAIHQAGESMTDHMEQIGFDGERKPTITEIVEDEEYGAAASE